MKPATCRNCGAPIIWARSTKTGRMAPLDVTPDQSHGKVLLDRQWGTYTILNLEMVEQAIERDFPLYVNHLSHCERQQKAS